GGPGGAADGLGGGTAGARGRALDAAGNGEVDYVAAGAASSPSGDRGEAMALRRLFDAEPRRVRTSAIKSMLGDAGAAAGMLQVIACLLAAEHGHVPPTINCEDEDPECRVPSHVRGRGVAHTIPTAVRDSLHLDRAASLVVRSALPAG